MTDHRYDAQNPNWRVKCLQIQTLPAIVMPRRLHRVALWEGTRDPLHDPVLGETPAVGRVVFRER